MRAAATRRDVAWFMRGAAVGHVGPVLGLFAFDRPSGLAFACLGLAWLVGAWALERER